MIDTELQSRLEGLGMHRSRAAAMTRHIRDWGVPVSSVAALRLAQLRQAQGLSGYDDEQLGKLFKKVRKALKKVGKGAVRVVKKAAPFLPAAGAVAIGASLLKRRGVKVPKAIAQAATDVAITSARQGFPADPAALMQAMYASESGMNSGPAAQLLQQAADEGVEQTPQGPGALPPWAIPAGIGAAVLLLLVSRR